MLMPELTDEAGMEIVYGFREKRNGWWNGSYCR